MRHVFPPMEQQTLVDQEYLFIIEASRSLSDKPHLIGLLWVSDQRGGEDFT